MKRLYLPLLLFLLLILEGVAIDLLPIKLLMSKSLIVPHWILILLIFIAIFYDNRNSYFSIFYSVIFGLLIDIVYTEVLGVYMFSYGIVIYLIYELKNFVHANLLVTIILGAIGLSLADISITFIYTIVNITEVVWIDYYIYRLLPTVIANLLFLIILYPIISKQLLRMRENQFS